MVSVLPWRVRHAGRILLGRVNAAGPATAPPILDPPVARPVNPAGQPIFYATGAMRDPSPGDRPDSIPGPVISSDPVFVADSSRSIVDSTGLHMLFCAIFRTSTLSSEAADLFSFALGQPQLWSDRSSLHLALVRRLLQDYETRPDPRTLDCLRLLNEHQRDSRENATAYSTTGKPVPNAVTWPNPTLPQDARSLFDEMPIVKRYPLIDKTTPITSAGSCFAMEIAHELQRNQFNYLITERDPNRTGLPISSAAWGTIFNTGCLRQLFEKSFGKRVLPRMLWSRVENGQKVYRDPFREEITFNSIEEYESRYESHLWAARQALLEASVFVFTLGMNEVWQLKSDGSVFARAPWGVMPDLVERRVLTVEENVANLQAAFDLLRRYNPGVKLLLSVSPVPLHATFRGEDTHVVVANAHAKALLRVVAEEFVSRNRDFAHYMPSYEVVMYCTRTPWQEDQRHVSREAVANVMKVFRELFVRPETLAKAA